MITHPPAFTIKLSLTDSMPTEIAARPRNKRAAHLRDRYTQVALVGDLWNTSLQVGSERFSVVEKTCQGRAKWFQKMLVIALNRFIQTEVRRRGMLTRRKPRAGNKQDRAFLRNHYTRAVSIAGPWNVYLQVDHQGFAVANQIPFMTAKRQQSRLVRALEAIIEAESEHGFPPGLQGDPIGLKQPRR